MFAFRCPILWSLVLAVALPPGGADSRCCCARDAGRQAAVAATANAVSSTPGSVTPVRSCCAGKRSLKRAIPTAPEAVRSAQTVAHRCPCQYESRPAEGRVRSNDALRVQAADPGEWIPLSSDVRAELLVRRESAGRVDPPPTGRDTSRARCTRLCCWLI